MRVEINVQSVDGARSIAIRLIIQTSSGHKTHISELLQPELMNLIKLKRPTASFVDSEEIYHPDTESQADVSSMKKCAAGR